MSLERWWAWGTNHLTRRLFQCLITLTVKKSPHFWPDGHASQIQVPSFWTAFHPLLSMSGIALCQPQHLALNFMLLVITQYGAYSLAAGTGGNISVPPHWCVATLLSHIQEERKTLGANCLSHEKFYLPLNLCQAGKQLQCGIKGV